MHGYTFVQCISDVYCILSSSFLKNLNNDRQQLHQYQQNEKLPLISNNCTQQDVARYVLLRIPPLKNSESHGKQEVDVQ